MDNCRVYEVPGGGVSIVHPNMMLKNEDETESEFLERIYQKAVSGTILEGQPHYDTTKDKLPGDRSKRDKWKMKADKKGLKIDESVITQQEKHQAVVGELTIEMGKPQGQINVEKVLKLQEKIRTKNYG